MPRKWDPLAVPPKGAQGSSWQRWFAEDITAFQREHPDMPQKFIGELSDRDRKKLIKAYHQARNEAELEEAKKKGDDFAKMVERFHRTGVLTMTSKRPSRK